MRSFLVLSLVSFSSFACPDLAGRYFHCQSFGSEMPAPQELSLTQRNIGGTTNYYLMTMDEMNQKVFDRFKADGRLAQHEISDPSSGMNMSYTSKVVCQGGFLEIETSILNEKIKILFSKQGKKLSQKITGSSKMNTPTIIICEQKI